MNPQTSQVIHRTITVDNAEHLDTVTVDLTIQVECPCPLPNSYVSSELR